MMRLKLLSVYGYWVSFIAQVGNSWMQGKISEESLTYYRRLGDTYYSTRALRGLAFSLQYQLEDTQARSVLVQEYRDLTRASGDLNEMAQALFYQAILVDQAGDYEQAERYFQEVVHLFQMVGDQKSVGISLGLRAVIIFLSDDFNTAIALSQKSVALADDVGYTWSKGTALVVLGMVAVVEGNYTEGRQLCQEGLSLVPSIGGMRSMWILFRFCHAALHWKMCQTANSICNLPWRWMRILLQKVR